MNNFNHPAFIKEDKNNFLNQPSASNSVIASLNFNNKLLLDETTKQQQNLFFKQEVNDNFQIFPTPSFENHNENTVFDNIHNNMNLTQLTPVKENEIKEAKISIVPIKKSLSTPLPNYVPYFLGSYWKAFWKRRIKKFEKIKINFGPNAKQDPIYNHKDNYVTTTKYNAITWFPKSLMMQFFRAANIYFLIITVLSAMPFSPQNPTSLFLTFSLVLVFTMLKEAYEDFNRYKQDKEVNNRKVKVFDNSTKIFIEKLWCEIEVGDFIKVFKDESIPCDLLFVKSSSKNGIAFVDTMNLDGETNLKEKIVIKETQELDETLFYELQGTIECDPPNEYLESFEATSYSHEINANKPFISNQKQLLLRGSTLKNTAWILGYAVYCGVNTKANKNGRKLRNKMSNVLHKMNKILYTVFLMEALLCIIFGIAGVKWDQHNADDHFYIENTQETGFNTYFIRFLVFVVAYSQLIPISLYVALEVLKLSQAYFVANDLDMYYKPLDKFARVKSSDLIEEMGQIEFIFSDKTGTLTCNEMEFKKCSIGGKIYSQTDLFQRDLSSFPDFNRFDKFFKLISICHTVVPDLKPIENPRNSQIPILYQASSPDELALINAAYKCGYKFLNRTANSVTVQINFGIPENWNTLIEFPFDSSRKRMSLIVENKNKYFLMTKGADSVMMDRCITPSLIMSQLVKHLNLFAKEGLRTLIMAQKEIRSTEYQVFLKCYENLKFSADRERERKLLDLYDSMEKGLELIGASAIEDKLQDSVPETIFKLTEAQIRVWVLTGDKQETAIEIAKSSKLIQENMDVLILTSKNKEELIKKLKKHSFNYNIPWEISKPNRKNKNSRIMKKMCLVIDGDTLAYIMEGSELLQNIFFKLGLIAISCICCRVSPKQKADVVKLAKSMGNWVTMAIGDGANDVSMIMEAHLGIGIYGKEGTQAARSADFAICQFKHLQKMLFVHGRWGYRRVSIFICYYFYKNCVMVFSEICFAFYNGFSGQIYFIDLLPLLFNAFWTSWPCMINFALDQDVNKYLSVKYPKLYQAGPLGYYFNMKVFWVWIFSSFYHGITCFWFIVFPFHAALDENGAFSNHWIVSTLSFSCMINLITIKLFLETSLWNKYNIAFGILSIIIYNCTLLLVCSSDVSPLVQPEINGLIFQILSLRKAWIVFFAIPLFGLFPDILSKIFSKLFHPNPVELVLRNSKLFE